MSEEQKTVGQVRQELDSKIPRDVISQREGGGRSKLSYLEGWYVIDRLNKVLGQGAWSYQVEEMRLVHEGQVQDKFVAHYIAKVRLEVPALGHCIFSDYGYGDGQDKYNPGKAHELATKEAVTDAVKRCAKNLGMSMGLALYDKSQENVDDGDGEPAPQPAAKVAAPGGNPRAVPVAAKTASNADQTPAAQASQSPAAKEGPSREDLNKLITNVAKVLDGLKKKPIAETRALIKSKYGADRAADLSDGKAQELYTELNAMLN